MVLSHLYISGLYKSVREISALRSVFSIADSRDVVHNVFSFNTLVDKGKDSPLTLLSDGSQELGMGSPTIEQGKTVMTMQRLFTLAISLVGMMTASRADATVYFDISQVGANVVVAVSGSFDKSVDTVVNTSYLSSGTGSMWSTGGRIILNSGLNAPRYSLTGSAVFGDGPSVAFSTASGIQVGISTGGGFTNGFFFISSGYVSNSEIAATGTVNGKTLAELGMSKNIFNFSTGNNAIVIRIDQPIVPTVPTPPTDPTPVPQDPTPNPQPAVPEPATWAMMLIGFGALGGMMRRRSAKLGIA